MRFYFLSGRSERKCEGFVTLFPKKSGRRKDFSGEPTPGHSEDGGGRKLESKWREKANFW